MWVAVPILVVAFASAQAQEEHQPEGRIVTVGNPNNPDALGSQIAEAYVSGARKIVVKSGTYLFTKSGSSIIVLNRWRNAKISGHGVTLVSAETELGNELIRLNQCTNIEVDDFTLSQSWQPSLQGRVTAISTAPSGSSACVWRPDAGYPLPDSGAIKLDGGPSVVDAKSRLLKHGESNEQNASFKSLGDGSYQVSLFHSPNLEVGDWLVARGHDAPSKVHLVGCHDCQISTMILYRNGSDTICENDGGGNSYYDCRWAVGPKPSDGTEKPILACASNGFRSVGAYPGPDIENCEFAGVSLGECIAIYGTLQQVKSSSGDTIVMGQSEGKIKEGQPIRIGANGFLENAFVKSVVKNGDQTSRITLDKILNVPAGAVADNPLWNGQSFKILNCHLGGTRSDGVLVRADGGLIQGNVIAECGMSAISAGPDYRTNEGDYVQDLSVKNNQFLKNGFMVKSQASLSVHGEGARGNRNLTVEGNTFDSNFSGDVEIDWTQGAIIRQNGFTAPLTTPSGLVRSSSISINSSRDIRVLRNQFKEVGNYKTPFVKAGTDVEGLSQEDNNQSGGAGGS